MPLSATQSSMPREVVVVEAEAAPHGLAVGEVEHLRGGQPLGRRGRAAGRRRRAPGWSGAASGRRAGRAGRAARLGGGVDSSSSTTSPAPNVAWISGANVSMSGHITITSRGSSVGSSSSRCRIASRSTSTWRARPWQAWTWMLRSSSASGGRSARRRRGRRGRRPGCARAACRAGASTGWWWSTCSRAPSTSCSSRASLPPRGEQPVVGERGGRVVGAARRPRGARRATVSHSAGDGCSRKRCTSRCGGERAQARRGGRPGSRVRPNSERRVGQVDERRRRRAAARTRRSSRSAGLGLAEPRAQPPPQLGLPALASVARAAHAAHHLRPVQRVAVEQLGEVADGGEARARRSASPRAEVGGERRQPRLVQALVDDLEQRPDRALRQPRVGARVDARGGRDRVADQPARRTGTRRSRRRRRPGPAWRRGRPTAAASASAPSRASGTATTSGANGSGERRRRAGRAGRRRGRRRVRLGGRGASGDHHMRRPGR